MRLDEVDGKPLKHIGDRAGVYPLYVANNGQVYVYMMVPSNPKFGGALPQMGKGGVDKGETPEQAAMREGHEELGLLARNVKKISQLTTATITGKQDTYFMTVFVAEVFGKDDFDPHGYEAKWTGWVEMDEAIKVSRKNQQQFLRQVKSKYDKQQPLEEDVSQEKVEEIERWINHLSDNVEELEARIKELQKEGDPQGLFRDRNIAKAKLQHAKSQLDLINLNVDPLYKPGPEDNDTGPEWGDWARALAPVIKRIKSECKPYLDAINYNVLEYRLYRGMKGTDAPYMSGRVRLSGRKPQAMGTHVHDAVNEYFKEGFGAPFRNALFTSSNPNFAADYGNLFIVFPTGKFRFIWSPVVEDLYNHEWALDEALDDDKADDDMPSDGNFFRATMDNYYYQDTSFIKAMESKQEIMIRTPVYYGINLSNFWVRNDYDDDSVGEMSDVNQAMKIIQELLSDED